MTHDIPTVPGHLPAIRCQSRAVLLRVKNSITYDPYPCPMGCDEPEDAA